MRRERDSGPVGGMASPCHLLVLRGLARQLRQPAQQRLLQIAKLLKTRHNALHVGVAGSAAVIGAAAATAAAAAATNANADASAAGAAASGPADTARAVIGDSIGCR